MSYGSRSPYRGNLEIDPTTGAPLIDGGRPMLSHHRSSSYGYPAQAGYYPNQQFISPYHYTHPAYATSSYLTADGLPVAPASPQMVPQLWQTAYYNMYGQPTPYATQQYLDYRSSPSRRGSSLPSPNTSPYTSPNSRLVALPEAPDERRYGDPREGWSSRFKNWLSGEANNPQRQFARQEYLIHDLFDRKRSGLRWNVSAPPHTITVRSPPDPLASAFDPPLASCYIVSELMPWKIKIKARECDYITVIGLMGDIYVALKKPIDQDTYFNLPEEFRLMVDQTYKNRCYDIPDEEAAKTAIEEGLRKVDFLIDQCMFSGLEQIRGQMSTFELKLKNA